MYHASPFSSPVILRCKMNIRRSTLSLLAFFLATLIVCPAGGAIAQAAKKNDASLSDVQARGELIVGTDIPYGIMEFYDSSGQPAGIDMDIGRQLARDIGVSMKVKTMPFASLFKSLDNRTVDVVISAVTITTERQKKMLFSVPYLNAGMSIAVKKNNQDITSIEDLKHKNVGVLAGTIGDDLAVKSPHVNPSLIKRYKNNTERLKDLQDGKVDAIFVHFLVKDLQGIKLVGAPLSESYYGVVTRLGNHSLMDRINRTLRKLKRSGELSRIKKRYQNEVK